MLNKKTIVFILLLIIINIFINIRVLNYKFVEDDYPLIVNNNRIKNFDLLVKSFKTPFFKATEHPYLHYWRPMVLLSYYIDYKLYGLNSKGYHFTNILIHTVNVILIFLLLFFITKKIDFAFLSALIFSIHPSHAENIAWVSGRTDLLSTFFLLITTVFITFSLKEKSLNFSFIILSLIIFPLALLSKEIAFAYPFILFIILLLFKKIKDSVLLTLPFLIISSIIFLIHLSFSKAQTLFDNIGINHVNIVIKTIGIYFKILFFPFGKTPLYSMKRFDDENILPYLFVVLFLLFISIIITNRNKFKTSFYSLPILFFLTPIIDPKIIVSYPPIALRFIYITSIFSAIFLSELFFLFYKEKGYIFVLISFIAFLSAFTYKYFYFQGFYKDGYTRADKLVENCPDEGIYKMQLALILANKKDYKKALFLVEKALKLNKTNHWVDMQDTGNLFKANLLILTGEREDAERIFSQILKHSKKKNIKYICFLGFSKLYEKEGNFEKAIDYLNKGEKLFKTADLYFRKAIIYYYLKDFTRAITELEKARVIDPYLKNYNMFKQILLKKINSKK